MKKIFIDPGHGGADSGAVAFGLVEKDINLTVTKLLKKELQQYGFDVKMSRETDIYVGLIQRANMANEWNADIFISIHHNAGGGDGWEIIHSMMSNKKDKSKQLAELIGREFTAIGQNARQVSIYSKESINYPGNDYFTVLRYAEMPAIITEFAFLDSNDRFIIDTSEEQEKESQAIVQGIINFTGVKKSEHWAKKYCDYLRANGIVIHEERFDEPATRGDVFALMARMMGYKE